MYSLPYLEQDSDDYERGERQGRDAAGYGLRRELQVLWRGRGETSFHLSQKYMKYAFSVYSPYLNNNHTLICKLCYDYCLQRIYLSEIRK
jgi:hypothetical protein